MARFHGVQNVVHYSPLIAMTGHDHNFIPAYTPSPGEILAAELTARGWSQRQFALILGKPHQAVNEIMRGKKQITPETALRIAAAFGTSAELWINLEADYRLAIARQQIPYQTLAQITERSNQSTAELA